VIIFVSFGWGFINPFLIHQLTNHIFNPFIFQSILKTAKTATPMETGEDNVRGNKRVYIGNLSWSVTWRDLKDHMASAGEVTRADVLTGHDGRSKGCGIVEFSRAEEASTAIATLNNTEIMGRDIFVREDREQRGGNTGGGGAPSQNHRGPRGGGGGGDGKSVYVGNLAYEVQWQDLKDHMRSCGDVAYAEVMTMNDGRSKGCGIVEFVSADGAARAIAELNDSELQGRAIFVREDREGGGGGSGGRPMREGDGGYQGGWQQNQRQGGGRGNSGLSVYVGNLSYETTWQDLKDHMRQAGNVDKVRSCVYVCASLAACCN